MTTTARPDVLVSADWAKAHLDDPTVRFVEVDVDTTAYDQSHLPGAVGGNWTSQLSDDVQGSAGAGAPVRYAGPGHLICHVVQGCVLFIAFCTVTVNLLTDLVYSRFDPRIRY